MPQDEEDMGRERLRGPWADPVRLDDEQKVALPIAGDFAVAGIVVDDAHQGFDPCLAGEQRAHGDLSPGDRLWRIAFPESTHGMGSGHMRQPVVLSRAINRWSDRPFAESATGFMPHPLPPLRG